MIVKATKDIDEYFILEKEKEYVVYGCEYHLGLEPTQRQLSFYVKTKTVAGGMALISFNASNFEIIESSIPDDWKMAVFDYKQKQEEVMELFREANNETEVAKRQKWLKNNSDKKNLTYIISFPEMTEFSFFISVHDYDYEESTIEIMEKYINKYEKLYAEYLAK